MSSHDPKILEFEISFDGRNPHDFAAASASAISSKGWHRVLNWDGLPSQQVIAKMKEEKSESLKACPHDLSYGPDPALDKNLSPEEVARAQRLRKMHGTFFKSACRPFYDNTGKPEDAETSALRNAFWAYIVRNVPPRFRQGIRTGDVFDFMARFTDTYLIRRTIDIRSTRREWWSLQIRKNESLSSLFDRFDKIKAQLADDGIDLSDADLRSSLMDGIAYYIKMGPQGVSYHASPFMRAVSSIRDEENLLKTPFSYPE